MTLSEDRLNFLAHIVTDAPYNDDLVDFTDDDQALRFAKQAFNFFVQEEIEIEAKTREKVKSLKRQVIEGSPEWDILFKKYAEEERNRRGKS